MKWLLILFLLVPMTANAEMWLWIDKTTKEVKSLSNEDDARVDKDKYELIMLPGDYSTYPLSYAQSNYKYISVPYP